MASSSAKRSRAGSSSVLPGALPLLLVGLLLGTGTTTAAAAPPAPPQTPPLGTAQVSSAAQFLKALEDPAVNSISVMKPFAMPHGRPGVKPAVVQRQVLITSPIRAMIDWCDRQCQAAGSKAGSPLIIMGKGAMVTFNRLFFRNFIPHSSSALRSPGLDFKDSPVPWVVSRDGGQATYNLVVMHWTPPMFWVYKQPGTFWQQAAVEGIKSVGVFAPIQFKTPDLYVVKSFSTDAGTVSMTDCYMPVDVNSCLKDQPYDTTLIYCPYTFKDSLKNPWVDTVVVFHDVGLDRLVNSYRNPAVVDRPVTYVSCPGTRHIMDLDNITNSVLVTAGGSLTLQNLAIQGSKSQNKTDWPSNIPLLLSTFRPVESGTIVLRDSTVRVQHMDEVITALNKLPQGSSAAVEIPDLQPAYVGDKAPQPGAKSFRIRSWQLQRQRYLLTKAGGSTIMDKIGQGSTASWQFFNVSVEGYKPPDCFAAAVTQGSLVRGQYAVVSSGQELLDQLANASARYIGVDSSLSIPPNLGTRRITVNRIVEIRSCTPGPALVVDWGSNHDSVIVTGNAIFEGNMAFKGIGWTDDTVQRKGSQVVDALHPAGTGIIEYEDVTLLAEIPESAWDPDAGKSSLSKVLGVQDLDASPLNMSLVAPNKLLLRGHFLNNSNITNGIDGMESFQDVVLCWSKGSSDSGGSGGLSKSALLAAVIVPIVVVGALLGALLACCCYSKHRSQRTGASGKDVDDTGKGSVLPQFLAGDCFGLHGGKGPWPGSGTGSAGGKGGAAAGAPLVVAVKDGTASFVERTPSGTTCGGPEGTVSGTDQQKSLASTSHPSASRSKAQSGFNTDIAQACQALALKKRVGRDDELVLESVLGEGSYGKVFKATWRGTVVAVKIMVLPSHMTGKEKREKMAVMEAAISSSLSHPNCVATYTYSVEPLRSNSTIKDIKSESEGPGAGLSMHDSTQSWRASENGSLAALHKGSGNSGSSDMGAFSWEVRLVQEFCDLGSLRNAFKANRFKSASGAVQLVPLAETALDVARAMAHLHQHNIVHSDLKARNVLLRSDMQDPRGFTAKVADFGLSLTIDPNSTHISNAFQGTMTHMAPETLMHGHISRASDVFAFGILLWELYTGDHAYKGIPRALLGHNISKQGMRPVFPPDTPFEWQFLACRCWESDPAIRPTFDQILEELKRIKARWAASSYSSDASTACNSASPVSSSSIGDDSLQQQQQHPRLGGGQDGPGLPCIHSDSHLPSSDTYPPQQHDYMAHFAHGSRPAHAASAAAAAGHSVSDGPALKLHAAGGAHTWRQQQQQLFQPQPQQQRSSDKPPLPHMCFTDVSRDALVFLSDCDGTQDSLRP